MCWSEKGDRKSVKEFVLRECEGNIGNAVEHKEKLCDGEETVNKFTYLGDRESAGGGCEAAVTASTRCRRVALKECGEWLYGRTLPPKLNGAVDKSYVRLAVLYGVKHDA